MILFIILTIFHFKFDTIGPGSNYLAVHQNSCTVPSIWVHASFSGKVTGFKIN
jgi:hypothetical protein